LTHAKANLMTCQDIVALTTEYLEGALTSKKQKEFAEHVSTCSSCQTHLEHMRLTVTAVGKLREDRAEPEVSKELLDHFRRRSEMAPERAQVATGRRFKLGFTVYAAAALVAVIIGAWLWSTRSPATRLNRASYQPMALDLSSLSAPRSDETDQKPPRAFELRRGRWVLSIQLPRGSEPGNYQAQFLRPDQAAASLAGNARIEDGKTILRVNVDLTTFKPGNYTFAVRRPPGDWTYCLLVLK
jgi:hypothetical protein